MKTYEKYKDSGIAWIGEIPEGWKILPHKYILRKTKEICEKYNGEDIISLTMKGVIKRDLDNPMGKMPLTFDGYQKTYAGNLLLCLFDIDVTPRCVGLIKDNGLTSPAYSQFKFLGKDYPQYYTYLLTALDDDKCLLHLSKNLRSSLSEDAFGAILTIQPSINEQQAIADYLDEKCGAIDKAIDTEKDIIEKLKEYKQSIITETVTKGLDKSAPMKDSGIPWIGQIPQHWEIKRTKHIASAFYKGSGITKDDVTPDGDIQCIRYGEIYSKYDKKCTQTVSKTNLNSIDSPRYICKGDILFAGTGELVEEIGKNIVYMGDAPCLAGGDIIILKHRQNPIFLNYVLNNYCSQAQKSYGKVKLKVVHISVGDIGNIMLALPPIREQQAIADYLDEKCTKIDKVLADKEQVIEKLTEYKKSLIYECVTGKRRVA